MRLLISLAVLIMAGCAAPAAAPEPASSIYWSDGDSGRIDGVDFRLANVDAPETGGVGARGGADCEAERALGYEAKAFIVELTRGADLEIRARYGTDRHERVVIDLSAGGVDVGEAGLASGHFQAWPHRGRTALADKPDWCGHGR